ncbi:PTS sugar transporter subunit IIA [Lederbergia wuyishanensis]|uniref:Mannitol-specific phosphotransferase enzyme IIA component n=1 Tax=Lederbergia wuyishanensis TaxID=1347903 RepID=A0ABU0D6F9_9BACI|nr:PTS sugar transporter subunit IIA [Lederbergia wuyishanensis]MCJ8008587.1 PTS sugar transporter subunit IIA [Lederbergia wuyishanensis]MDQ0343998.1 PTS system mannitol-specific IIC component [Lederbergia wuyishanensis]
MGQFNIKLTIQKLGNLLSSMVMPNISAFIVWGLLAALFLPAGLLPNENISNLPNIMITCLLPLLIAYTGGKLVYDQRGAVVGAIATVGVIAGSDIPMIIGAMFVGPFAAYVLKKVDLNLESRIKSGFEMLVNNFTAAIVGGLIAIGAFFTIGPAFAIIIKALSQSVFWLADTRLLPFSSILIEPAKLLFLNNALNHGILLPIGIEQVMETGKSVLFLMESNPGPGIGVLIGISLFGKGSARRTAPGAMLIQFFGGIHEVYFPYILMRPLLIIAVIFGGICGIGTLVYLDGGVFSPISPGSIFSILALTPQETSTYIANLSGILVAGIVSFLISIPILKTAKDKEIEEANLVSVIPNVTKIHFACDAGMGSSVMGASLLRKKVEKIDENIEVLHSAINDLPEDAQLVITQKELTDRAKNKAPNAHHISVEHFLSSSEYDKLIEHLQKVRKESSMIAEKNISLLLEENIFLNQRFTSKEEVIRFAGNALVQAGYVNKSYIDAMIERDEMISTYMGHGIAIPHGTEEAKKDVIHSGITVIQVPEGVDFNGQKAYLIFGIAGKDGAHLKMLSQIAVICSDSNNIEKMVRANNVKEIIRILDLENKEES